MKHRQISALLPSEATVTNERANRHALARKLVFGKIEAGEQLLSHKLAGYSERSTALLTPWDLAGEPRPPKGLGHGVAGSGDGIASACACFDGS